MSAFTLKFLKTVSIVCGALSVGWVFLLLIAANLKQPPSISVRDGSGKLIVTGVRYYVLNPEHWWRDVVVRFGPSLTILIISALLLWYCSKRLRLAR